MVDRTAIPCRCRPLSPAPGQRRPPRGRGEARRPGPRAVLSVV